jgi:hypothetical protein
MSYAVGEEGRLGKSAGRTTYGSNFGKSTMNESKRGMFCSPSQDPIQLGPRPSKRK